MSDGYRAGRQFDRWNDDRADALGYAMAMMQEHREQGLWGSHGVEEGARVAAKIPPKSVPSTPGLLVKDLMPEMEFAGGDVEARVRAVRERMLSIPGWEVSKGTSRWVDVEEGTWPPRISMMTSSPAFWPMPTRRVRV